MEKFKSEYYKQLAEEFNSSSFNNEITASYMEQKAKEIIDQEK